MKHPIFITIVGSKLYGNSTEQSDTDIKGLCFGHIDQLIGMRHFEQLEVNNNKDGPEHVEGVIFEVKKYLEKCYGGNPTLIEMANSDSKYHILTTAIGLEVVEFLKKNCITKSLFKPYSAYFKAQMRKMMSMEREGKRKEIVDKFGFDVKYASHNWRLGNQCIQIMKEGFLNPTMEGEVLKICKDIRSGIYNKEQALKLMEEIDIKMYDAYKESKLPETPDFHKMNDFLVKLYKEYISGANIQEIEQITTNEQYKDVVQLIQGK